MEPWLEVLGRAHPLVLHLPIGLLAGLVLWELCAARRSPRPPLFLVFFTALSAGLAAFTGDRLSHEPGYGGAIVELHERLGFAVAGGCALLCLLSLSGALRELYRLVLLATVLLIVPAGHLGATLTHGEDFLTEPLRSPAGQAVAAEQGLPPLFASSCVSCHNPSKRKGGLDLSTRAGAESGGENGPAFAAGRPQDSELLRRLRLPLDAADHMPPKNKAQPAPQEIEEVAAWILGRASAGEAAPAADPSALRALQEQLAHVQPLAQGSNLLWVDFAAPAETVDDALAMALLEPLREQVAHLSLARTRISDATLALLARMPRLERLDLRGTAVTDYGIATMRKHEKLEELILVQTRLSDATIDYLAVMPALRRLYAWDSGIGPEALQRLAAQRPELHIDAGDLPSAAVLETEGEIRLSSDAPIPGAEALPLGLAPVNATCPVSGSPVNPKYAVVFEGRVIGFCCPNCPRDFWADPEQFRAKLP